MDNEYWDIILNFYKAHRRFPGYNEMMRLCKFKSKNAVYKLINRLVERGLLEKDSDGRISPGNMFGDIKMLGLVEAGIPSLAEEDISESINLDELLVKKPGETYMLTVKGDSMIEAGIQEGDLILAERNEHPRVGDIVIAEVDGGWTMKYFRKKGSAIYLEPANKHLKNIYPQESMQVAAIVKAVIRTYK